MSNSQYDPNDPKLTAYVLGELNETDSAEVERQLEKCADSRAAVAELRELTGTLSKQLAAEPALELTAEQRTAIQTAAKGTPSVKPAAAQPVSARGRGRGWAVISATVSVLAVCVLVLALPPRNDGRMAAVHSVRGDLASASLKHVVLVDSSGRENKKGKQRGRYLMLSENSSELSSGRPQDESEVVAKNSLTSSVRDGTSASFAYREAEKTRLEARKQQLSALVAQQQVVGTGTQGTAKNPTLRTDAYKVAQESLQQSRGTGLGRTPARPSARAGDTPLSVTYTAPAPGNSSAPVPAQVRFTTDGKQVVTGKPPGYYRNYTTSQFSITNGIANNGQAGQKLREVYAGTRVEPGSVSNRGANLDGTEPDPSNRLRLSERRLSGSQLFRRAEVYAPIIENDFLSPLTQPQSTFGIDVDTASYSNMRRFLTHRQLPPPDAVRIEELVNYFPYDYPEPADGQPFSVTVELGVCPWQAEHQLVRIGLKGRDIDHEKRPPSNLVFLLDVSGSMRDNNKLPLVKSSLEMLVKSMTEDDRIAIVTYAGKAGLHLDSVSGEYRDTILSSIDSLSAGGSTNGEAGIKLAYEQTVKNFIENGSNRVILCTDGDFNVGISDGNELVQMITEKAKSNVFLSIFGFGMGNLKDAKLEQLADKGNGHYAYIDGPKEARKVFVEEMTGTLYTIAKDVKIQVDFNPKHVGAYRLLGYENRALATEDFDDDSKDAGEIGAGHRVTALYQLIPPGKVEIPEALKSKYRKPADTVDGKLGKELLTVKLRYKQPDAQQSIKREFPIQAPKDLQELKSAPSQDFEWAATVAAFGLVLRNSQFRGQANLELVNELALGCRGGDKAGHRREFIELINTARAIKTGKTVAAPAELSAEEAEEKAAVSGKYGKLLKKLEVRDDLQTYGQFYDFGQWEGTSYAGSEDLPTGHWVYVYPNWYIWKDKTAK